LVARSRVEAAEIHCSGSGSHDERAHSPRLAQRVGEAGPAAHRLGNQAHILQREMVHERREVVGKVLRGARAVEGVRGHETAMCECDARVARCEMGNLLPPGEMVAAQAMREHDCRSAAFDLVVDAAVRALQETRAPHRPSRALRVQCAAFTAPFGARPLTISAACATVSSDWCSIAGRVRPAECGVAMTSERAASRGVGIWSGSRPTSMAQPPRWPESSARSSAASSTRLPRDMFTKKAPFFIFAKAASFIR